MACVAVCNCPDTIPYLRTLISKSHSVDDYLDYVESDLRFPRVEITSEDTATVRFMA